MRARRPSQRAGYTVGHRLSVAALSLSLGLGFLLTVALSEAEAHTSSLAEQHVRAQPPGAAEQATQTLLALGARYQAADPTTRAQLLGTLTAAATARQQLLAALIEEDPGTVLRVALPAGLAAGLPAAVRAFIEKEADLEGTLEVLHEDRVDGSRYLYRLETATERLSLHFAADPPELLTGSHVRVRGVRITQALALDSGTTSVQTLAAAALPNTFGAQSTLVMLVNFADNATQPYTPSYAQGVVFTATSQFDTENSYGQTWLTGNVAGWYTISLSSTTCDYNTLASQANSAASAAGADLSIYTRYVYAFPFTSACSWSGLGTVGGHPSKAWINGTLNLRVVAHEMGHNLGLYHSHWMDCGTVVLGGTCATSEYGDLFDTMGAAPGGHFNAFQKERLGWLNYGASPPITTVTGSGSYTLQPYEAQTPAAKALKVLQSTNSSTGQKTWYYVEYRQALGFDSFLSGSTSAVTGGVVVHLGTDSSANSSYLLDMTPDSSSFADAAIDVGQSYTDSSAGVTITPTSADTTGATVSVTLGSTTCVAGNPTVTVSPSQSQWLRAGSTVTYTVSVTNNDSVGCAPATFTLQASAPAGWMVGFAAPSVTVSPASSASVTLSITSPTTATDGFYTIGMSATNAALPSYTAAASVTYVVVSSLSVGPSTSQASYTRRQTVSITAVVTADGLPVANALVTFTVTKSNGAVATGIASTGANGVAVYQLQLRQKDPVGAYQARVNASLSSTLSGSATTSFTVQ